MGVIQSPDFIMNIKSAAGTMTAANSTKVE
jgi:hypothetical protein